jgi:hypothetical protein
MGDDALTVAVRRHWKLGDEMRPHIRIIRFVGDRTRVAMHFAGYIGWHSMELHGGKVHFAGGYPDEATARQWVYDLEGDDKEDAA